MNFSRSLYVSIALHGLFVLLVPGFNWHNKAPDWVDVSVVAYPDNSPKVPDWQSGKKVVPKPVNNIKNIEKTDMVLPLEETSIGVPVAEEAPAVMEPDELFGASPYRAFEKIMPGMETRIGKLDSPGEDAVPDITGPVTRRKLIRKIYPRYPSWAEEQGVEGAVKLKFWVNAEGLVTSVELLQTSGYPDFDSRGIEALKKYIFSPLDVTDTDENQWGTIIIKYTLK